MNSNFQIITASYGKYFRNRCGKEAGIGRNKKEPVTVLLILINTLIFLVVEFTGGLGERAAYVGIAVLLMHR